jgi:hypothetical protein
MEAHGLGLRHGFLLTINISHLEGAGKDGNAEVTALKVRREEGGVEENSEQRGNRGGPCYFNSQPQ